MKKNRIKKLIKYYWMNRMWILKLESSFYRQVRKYRINNEEGD